jgi:thioredoxin-related protein
MIKIAASTLALFTITTLTAQEATHLEWYADFDVAAAAAKKANKDLLVDFTGSDWCGWCIKLHEEVFDHAEFEAGVKDHFVLVALDFPRGDEAKAKVPNPERNKELSEQHGIKGFPTILLMTPDGEVFGKTGYQAGGPVTYVESLDKMRTEGKKNLAEVKSLVKQYDATEGEDHQRVLVTAIDLLSRMDADQIGIDEIAAIVLDGVEAEDLALQEKAIVALLKSGQADEACMAKAEALDPDNKKGLLDYTTRGAMTSVHDDESAKAFLTKLDHLIAKGAKDVEVLEGMLANAARWTAGPLKDKEASVKYAKLLKEKAKDPAKHTDLLNSILGEGN